MLFIPGNWGIVLSAALAVPAFFLVRALIRLNKRETGEKKDIGNITDWSDWDTHNEMPIAQKYPKLMEEARKRVIQKEFVMIDSMKLPEMLKLCERAIPFPSLQFDIKQKIKCLIEAEYKSLEGMRGGKSSEIADRLNQLGHCAIRVGSPALAMNINRLEENYRPSRIVVEALEKAEV